MLQIWHPQGKIRGSFAGLVVGVFLQEIQDVSPNFGQGKYMIHFDKVKEYTTR